MADLKLTPMRIAVLRAARDGHLMFRTTLCTQQAYWYTPRFNTANPVVWKPLKDAGCWEWQNGRIVLSDVGAQLLAGETIEVNV